jgi:hypothetical protein
MPSFRISSIMYRSCSRLVGTSQAFTTLILIPFLSRKSQIEVSQHAVIYRTHSLGSSNRWKPHPDSFCRERSAMTIIFPMESLENTWSVRCCMPLMPCSTLMFSSAMPHKSFGPNATRQGKRLVDAKLVENRLNCSVYLVQYPCIQCCHWKRARHRWNICTSVKDEGIHLIQVGCQRLSRILVSLVQEKLTLLSKVSIWCSTHSKCSSCLPNLQPGNYCIVWDIPRGECNNSRT